MKKSFILILLLSFSSAIFIGCEDDKPIGPGIIDTGEIWITPRIIIKDKNEKEIDVRNKLNMTLASVHPWRDGIYTINSKHSLSYQIINGDNTGKLSLNYHTAIDPKTKKHCNYGYFIISGAYIGTRKDYQAGETGVATFKISIPDLWGEGKTHILDFHWRVKIKERSNGKSSFYEAEEFKITKIVVDGVEQAVIDMDGYHWCTIYSFD